LALERLPKSVQRFSDKRRGENKGLEQERDSEITHSALALLRRFSNKTFSRSILLSRFATTLSILLFSSETAFSISARTKFSAATSLTKNS